MRSCVATLLWLTFAVPVLAQEPLTVMAALDEAISSNPELLALRQEAPADRVFAFQRAAGVLAAVRHAHAELVIARDASAVYEGQSTMMKEMADALTLSGSGETGRHDASTMVLDIARLALGRSSAREQVKVAELRLNAVLGRRLEAAVGPLAVDAPAVPPADAVEVALVREPRLLEAIRDTKAGEAGAASERDRGTATALVRRRVLETLARVEGARERVLIMTSTVLPQVELAFEHVRSAYASGQGGFLEMLDAHHRQVEARIEYTETEAAYRRVRAALDVAMGETPERLARAAGAALAEK